MKFNVGTMVERGSAAPDEGRYLCIMGTTHDGIVVGEVENFFMTPAVEHAVGSTVPLTLERISDHQELEAEFMREGLPVSEADLWTDGQPSKTVMKT